MSSFGEREALGVSLMGKTTSKDEKQLLDNVGLFGVHMAVIGLGVEVFGRGGDKTGRSLMKLGAVLGAAGYGARWIA
jgi:hypothetical protein